eukprot:CAMPEP_0178477074 /NCGR_PEP_ID=MMETSP0696-20121128/3948_1 /TAXON_ID=265572 /ORGANISM="Extubocellulus spinifer, Strain CCMP396" /LENGTH=52 /DNA_ID=CAMNT_0020104383 /DNA_START=116 /DNA_END=274 /DNA_ORIENTATION=+
MASFGKCQIRNDNHAGDCCCEDETEICHGDNRDVAVLANVVSGAGGALVSER